MADSSKGHLPMRRHLTLKNILIAALVLLVLVAQGITWYLLGKTDQKINTTQTANQQTLNELDGVAQQQSLSPIPGTDRLYLPELNITIPRNPTTSAIRYSFNYAYPSTTEGEIRLTSAYMTDHTTHVKSCSDMVRLKIESKPNAYSPDQPLYATVQLANGNKLQVYASTTKECQTAWQTVSPQTVAEAFKSAVIY